MTTGPQQPVLWTDLPGPDRKRTQAPYIYQLAHREADPNAVGCVLLWHVAGGRMPYQIALERGPAGSLRLHCTCADAIYRGEMEGHLCKHVRGLLEGSRRHLRTASPASRVAPACVGA